MSSSGIPPPEAEQRAGIQSLEVGFALLHVLTSSAQAQMLRDLAQGAQMSPAKAHRYLVSFQRIGMVEQDRQTGRYQLGPAALHLGLAALARLDPVQMARTCLPALMQELGHTVALAVWGNHGPTLVHWQEPPWAGPVNLRIGDVMPLLTSASGRCFAAYLTDKKASQTERIWAMLRQELALIREQKRSHLPSNKTQVLALFEEVRRHGMARAVDVLLPGVAGLCAPVFDADGRMVLGIVTLGAASQLDTRWSSPHVALLRQTAARLSQDLGHRA